MLLCCAFPLWGISTHLGQNLILRYNPARSRFATVLPCSTSCYLQVPTTFIHLVNMHIAHVQINILGLTEIWGRIPDRPGLFQPVVYSIVGLVCVPNVANNRVLIRSHNSHFCIPTPLHLLWGIYCLALLKNPFVLF